MARPNRKKNPDDGASWREAGAALRAEGPQRLYVLCGQEDYLCEQFLTQLKAACIPGGEDEFSYHRFDGAAPDLDRLSDAVDAMPFLSERSLIEIRGCDTNKLSESEADKLIKIISDLPEYCTVVFLPGPELTLDGRLRITKALKKHGVVLEFTAQDDSALIKWMAKRFDVWHKRVTVEDARYLIQITGGLMNRMIPEIDKIAAYAAGEAVTRADIDAVAQKTPDAVVYEITDCLSRGNHDGAMERLSELLKMRDSDPIMILAVVGQQMRRLYAARIAETARLSTADAMALCDLRYDYLVQKTQRQARSFPLAALERAILLCAETDYAMKHTGADDVVLLEELLLQIMAEAKRR